MTANAKRLGWSVLAVLFLVSTAFSVPAPEPTKPERGETPAEKLRKVLDQPTTVEFENLTLSAAIDSLRQQTKANIALDTMTLRNMGYDPDQLPVHLKLKDVKLRTVLKHLLSPYQMTCVIDGDVLLVTAANLAAERLLRQEVSIDFNKTPLETALKQLAKETGVNIIFDKRHADKVKDTVTLQLNDVPLEAAVRLMCELCGMRSARMSNMLFVTTREAAAELYNEGVLTPSPLGYGTQGYPTATPYYSGQTPVNPIWLQQPQPPIALPALPPAPAPAPEPTPPNPNQEDQGPKPEPDRERPQ